MVEKWNLVIQQLPQIISRLASLKTVHDESINFSKCLKSLQNQQREITKLLQSQEHLLSQIEKGFQTNTTIIEKNITNIDARISTLIEKIKILESNDGIHTQ